MLRRADKKTGWQIVFVFLIMQPAGNILSRASSTSTSVTFRLPSLESFSVMMSEGTSSLTVSPSSSDLASHRSQGKITVSEPYKETIKFCGLICVFVSRRRISKTEYLDWQSSNPICWITNEITVLLDQLRRQHHHLLIKNRTVPLLEEGNQRMCSWVLKSILWMRLSGVAAQIQP